MADRLKQLIEKRNAVNARIKMEQGKLRATERKIDTRRKVLMGAWALEKAARDKDFAAMAMGELRNFLVRDDDRALFGFQPLLQKIAS
jgi:hypothetical protein